MPIKQTTSTATLNHQEYHCSPPPWQAAFLLLAALRWLHCCHHRLKPHASASVLLFVWRSEPPHPKRWRTENLLLLWPYLYSFSFDSDCVLFWYSCVFICLFFLGVNFVLLCCVLFGIGWWPYFIARDSPWAFNMLVLFDKLVQPPLFFLSFLLLSFFF